MTTSHIPFIDAWPSARGFALAPVWDGLVATVFNEHATAYELSTVVIFFAVLWFLVFYVIKTNLKPIVHDKPWLITALEREYERAGRKLCEDLKVSETYWVYSVLLF